MKFLRYGTLVVAIIGIVALLSAHFVTAAFFAGLLIGLVASFWVINREVAKATATAKLNQAGEEKGKAHQRRQAEKDELQQQYQKEKDELQQQHQKDVQSRTQELTQTLTAKEQRIKQLEQDLAKAMESIEIAQDRISQAPTILSAFNAAFRVLPGNPHYFVAKSDAERLRMILEKLANG